MNTIEISLEPDYQEISNGILHLKVKVAIDSIFPLDNPDDDFDIVELINSTRSDGNYFMWTCSCGVPGCAGYYNGIKVVSDDKETTWFDQDLNKQYTFLTSDIRAKADRIFDELLKWKYHAESIKVDLKIWPSWTIEYLIPAIKDVPDKY